MFYVFLVDTGTMMTFDMNLAMDTVSVLKEVIARSCRIPEDKQVLLVSGGESLDPAAKVFTYGCGTDTSPIFLFSKCSLDSLNPPCPSTDRSSVDLSMEDQVQGCLNMPSTYQTVVARTQLAQQFAEMAKDERRICERLVLDQHLQHQGWAAVIANLEDSTVSFRNQAEYVEHVFHQYLESRPCYQKLLQSFNSAICLLARIPLLPSLAPSNENEENAAGEHSLLNWLSAEPQSSLEHMAEQCTRWLDQFDEGTLMGLKAEVEKVLGAVDDPPMKEVKGLEDRLFGLEKLMCDVKKYEKDQIEQAQAFLQNQTRVSKLGDMSILPDLCNSHQHQLQLMLKNHRCLKEFGKKCANAKDELSANLHRRLRWILCVEKVMYDVNNRLAICSENLKRLSNHLEAIQQIHLAPVNYLKTVVEVYRRRNFSNDFLKWAGNLSQQSLELHKKEVTLRKAFNSEMCNNVITTLFPGMRDNPPPFATECPQPFDINLPQVLQEDLERLKLLLPELSNIIKVPPQEPMPQIYSASSDSAFSSEVPSSRIAGPSTPTSAGSHPLRTETQESLGTSKCSAAHEITSIASSPFEESFVSAAETESTIKPAKSPSRKKSDDSEVEYKRLHLTEREKETFSPIEEEKNESDVEEFEQVEDVPKTEDQFHTCVMDSETEVAKLETQNDFKSVVVSANDVQAAMENNSESDFPKARSEGDMLSPAEERLRSPDSTRTSQDFQPTDYFIDDSMPSSYTESNGTSALMRGNQMVKSHHVIVAELQRQLEEKNMALISAQGNLKMNRSNVLKLHGTINALQRFIQEVQEHLKSDFHHLRDQVVKERSLVLEEVGVVMERVKEAVAGIQSQMKSDQELAVGEALKRERENHETVLEQCQQQLEVESQKLSDAHREIEVYQEQLRQHSYVLENFRQDADARLQEVKTELQTEKDDLVKEMVLEHELELDNLRDQSKQKIQELEEEIKDLKEALHDKETEINLLYAQRDQVDVLFRESLQQKQLELVKAMETTYEDREKAAVSWAIEQQQKLHQEELQRLQQNHEEITNDIRTHLKQEFEQQWEVESHNLKLEWEANQQSLFAKWQQEKELGLQELKETLEKNYKSEMESMRSRFKLAYSTTSIERTPSDSSLETLHVEKDVIDIARHEKIVAQVHEKLEADKAKSIAESLEAEYLKHQEALIETVNVERRKHETEITELTARLQREHEENIQRIKAQLRAEKQITFNEAVNRVSKEKDAIIEELRRQVASFETQTSMEKANLERILQEKGDVAAEASQALSEAIWREKKAREGCQIAEYKLHETEQRLEEITKQSELSASVLPLPESLAETQYHKLHELQMKLQKKEAELAKFQIKFMEFSMSPGTQALTCTDKVSVLSCSVGDVVLLCYDEKHENYMVFNLGSVLHFLHTECLEQLDLRIAPEEPRRAWALAEVTDKEYCQARKTNNRYKVPFGTRFYRVKAKPWDREGALKRHQQRRSGRLGGSVTASQTLGPSSAASGSGEASAMGNMSSSAI